MPNWNTHVQIAKIIGEQLKFTKEENELFVFGNILPNINNKYIVKDISKKYSHNYTHYNEDISSTYQNFYNYYKNQMKKKAIDKVINIIKKLTISGVNL